ncbi:SAM-dependent methyltransferase [Micromonospora sp. NPDC051296]|uniref:SAM-dependent methyltransferase n=1 Tax=Micromonospora sp. NPDC051296 TaxID=3155046 RepID=UPI00342E4A11
MVDSPAVASGEQDRPKLDTGVPQTARIWNYLLGGKDNFAADRVVGDQIISTLPQLAENARLSRAYLARAVRHLAGEAGVRQFLDIGTGLPTADNTHEVAQAAAPDARIVYVDNDPLVLAHARALLVGTPEGATDYVDADLRDPGAILREASRTLDLGKPVALILMGILGHIESDEEAKSIIDSIMDKLPSGSYLAMYDGSDTSEAVTEAVRIWNISANPRYHLRSPERIAGLFQGLDLVEPGVVSVTRWRPDGGSDTLPAEIDQYCAVGRKP